MNIKYEFLMMSFPGESVLDLLIARDDSGKIVGTMTVKKCGKVFEFNRLFVVEGFRERGIARGMIEFTARNARTVGGESLTGLVQPNNFGALSFYRKLGFFESLRLDGGVIVMTLNLNAEPAALHPGFNYCRVSG